MTKGEQARLWAWRLRVIKEADTEARNIARTCRYFGISRQAFDRWKRRYEAHGEAGLWDRPKRPQRSPTALPREILSKILYLRQHYHFGTPAVPFRAVGAVGRRQRHTDGFWHSAECLR